MSIILVHTSTSRLANAADSVVGSSPPALADE
jgi:hypothetical protein